VTSIAEDMVKIDLNDTLQQVFNDLELVIEQKRARVDVSGLPAVAGVGVLIHPLFYNLVNNALKFTRAAVEPVITVSAAAPEGRFVQLMIRDNGIGFGMEHAESIFNSFK